MPLSCNIDKVPQPELLSIQHDIQRAKMFLKRHSTDSGDNLYDHLSELLAKILSEQPQNAVDFFEEYSRQLKEKRIKKSSIQKVYVTPTEFVETTRIIKLFQVFIILNLLIRILDTSRQEVEHKIKTYYEKSVIPIPNLIELVDYLEQFDVGFPKSECILLNLSIRKLVTEKEILNVRFWGKILGSPKNYYVVEAELREEELSRRLRVESEENSEIEEEIGTGLNEKVYLVCNSPGLDDWIELPSVTPKQIVVARQIIRYFTGCLETTVQTFPHFPVNEGNYLRAQIARITATTLISPVGYFIFKSSDDEETGFELYLLIMFQFSGKLSINPNYHPLSVKNLTDPSLSNWCHHSRYIYEDGQTTSWDSSEEESDVIQTMKNSAKKRKWFEDSSEEEDEDEVGPSLLTSLSKDTLLGAVPAWTLRLSSEIQLDTAIATVRSNLWPGAVAFAKSGVCGNVYIGSGHKYDICDYRPPETPLVENQYKIGSEKEDRTLEEEIDNHELQLLENFESENKTDDKETDDYDEDDDDDESDETDDEESY
ncbi:GSCOCG00003689001-RA-CDS [Cotesia congregata]|nr:GSCOCG00003689001-RA-CDS [Cotesia congregata]